MRWLHVASAVAAVGGLVMVRFVLLPALADRTNGEETLQAIRPRFKRLFHGAMGTLLLTGFYNYLVVAAPKVREDREQGLTALAAYHPVMGFKILLSLALFTLGILLLKPAPGFEENRKTWLSVNVVLGMLILLLAALLRRLWAG